MTGVTKFCGGCNQELAVESFSVYLSGPRAGKTLARCKECWRRESLQGQRRYAERNPDRVRANADRQREARRANPLPFREAERKSAALLRSKIDLLKEERGCYDCGAMLPAIALDWDHVPERGVKRFNIGAQMKSYGLDSVLAEIEKCQCVCATCHRLRTLSRKPKGES